VVSGRFRVRSASKETSFIHTTRVAVDARILSLPASAA